MTVADALGMFALGFSVAVVVVAVLVIAYLCDVVEHED